MQEHLKIWQAVLTIIVLIITIGTTIVNQSNKIETQRLRIEFLESSQRDLHILVKDQNQQTIAEFKEVKSKLTDVLILLQNKQDKHISR